jgi:hypothetical protein
MSPELDNILCEKYPKIFVNRNSDVKESCMAWGFEHSDGWFNIIDKLCGNIQSHIDWSRKARGRALRFNRALKRAIAGDRTSITNFYFDKREVPADHWISDRINQQIQDAAYRKVPEVVQQVVADQVKEKFGTLRFYYTGGDDYVAGLVAMAESMSGVTCEMCGTLGKKQGGSWIKTLCEQHLKKDT